MKVIDVAFSGYVYSQMTGYDKSYLDFATSVSNPLDLLSRREAMATIKWLNKWGCRQFAIAYRERAADQIMEWYLAHKADLVPPSVVILEMSAPQIQASDSAFNDLASRKASERKGSSGGTLPVRIGRPAQQRYYSRCGHRHTFLGIFRSGTHWTRMVLR
jgi:hypothetical protein